MKASQIAHETRQALDVVVVQPSEWSSTWESRPTVEVAFGLRLPSDSDESDIRREATDYAVRKYSSTEDYDSALDERNDATMALYVAACLCDPNDIRNEPAHLVHPADTIRSAMSSGAIRRLFERIERLKVEQSPASVEADDDDVAALGQYLLDYGVPSWLDESAKRRLRRHASYMLSEFESDFE